MHVTHNTVNAYTVKAVRLLLECLSAFKFCMCFNRKETKEILGELEFLECQVYPVFL